MKKIIVVLVVVAGFLFLPEVFGGSKIVEAAEKTMYVNAKGDIVLRDTPSKDGIKIGTIKNKSEIKVLSTSKGWSYIKVGSNKGYVYASALSSENPNIPVVKGGLMPKNGMELTYWPGRSGLVGEKVKKETYKVETYHGSSYLIANGNGEFVYGEKENRLGIYLCECDWLLLEFEYPLIQGKNTYETYLVDGEEYEEVRKRKIFVESTSATIKVKAGTFKNVVILKDVYGNKYYLAKGMGFLKITGVNGKVLLELSSVK